jgi:hypothetical protein
MACYRDNFTFFMNAFNIKVYREDPFSESSYIYLHKVFVTEARKQLRQVRREVASVCLSCAMLRRGVCRVCIERSTRLTVCNILEVTVSRKLLAILRELVKCKLQRKMVWKVTELNKIFYESRPTRPKRQVASDVTEY